jgi:cyclic beta-1,2-glucan synthetase
LIDFIKRTSEATTAAALEEPIRDEIFSPERFEEYAVFLAKELETTSRRRLAKSLLPRMEDNYRHLVRAYRNLTELVGKGVTVSPAAEWLIDNFHIIEDQIREIREDLPAGYYRELPKISKGELAGYPRVYAIALTLVAHLDSYLDMEAIKRFTIGFQSVEPLSIGEIWAIPIALRLALVENLRRLANQTVLTQEIKEDADRVAETLFDRADHQPDDLQFQISQLPNRLGISELADCAFVSQLSKRLRDQAPELQAACDSLERSLSLRGTSIETLVHCDHRQEAAAQLSTGNIVNSMRLLSNVNWQDFFESVNAVDPILARDPAGAYRSMDFASRDRYRHVVERIAKGSGAREIEVAKSALALATGATDDASRDSRRNHVGYYLVLPGRLELEKKFRYRPTVTEFFSRKIQAHPTVLYFGILLLLIGAFLGPALWYARWLDAGPGMLMLIALTSLTPVSDSAFGLLNLIVSRIVPPRILPKLNLEDGIPPEARTFVVVPTMLANRDWISRMAEGLEIRYLANHDPNLYFALLTDFTDGDKQAMPGDIELLDIARREIDELNRRHPTGGGQSRFYLFHRRRQWNAGEGKWIGWERKRGKIHEFNRFLRGDRATSFIIRPEYSEFFAGFHYVITLDSDTQLPRDSARRLIETILHPFNQPQLDSTCRRVTAGYGVLQPRISITPESAGRTWFAQIFSGNTGIDPYTTAVSDVYQDLFGEGIYTGKGLYVVDAFEASLKDRVPENSLLSHDLFEGLFARTALVTDIEFLDDYPTQYEAYAQRQHRWTRGDWQLVQWLAPWRRRGGRFSALKDLPFVSRWKIIDNLRRSLIAPTTLLWLLLGWTVLPGPAVVWTLATLIILSLPPIAHTTNQFLLHPRGIPWTSHFWTVWGDTRTRVAQITLSIICLVHQSYVQADAICRALYRSFVSHRHRLQWISASEVEARLKRQNKVSKQIRWPTTVAAIGSPTLILSVRPDSLWLALPFAIAWLVFPSVVIRISRTKLDRISKLTPGDARVFRQVARRTWHFFESFVGPEDNWLPPDNFQDDPAPVVAHRTSPTNMGLLLLSTCSARDLGYINLRVLLDRLGKTLDTLMTLEKRFGHLFNWYDTRTLKPLWPEYISTVDSGNLAGHLIAVKQACLEIPEQDPFKNITAGLMDTLDILHDLLAKTPSARPLADELTQLLQKISVPPPGGSIKAWRQLLEGILLSLKSFEKKAADSIPPGDAESIRRWRQAAEAMVLSHLAFIRDLAPWSTETVDILGRADLSARLDHAKPLRLWVQELTKISGDLTELEEAGGFTAQITSAIGELNEGVRKSIEFCRGLIQRSHELAWTCNDLMMKMDFSFLFDKQRKVFPIGFNVQSGTKDNSFYDLLASEARLASFVAIAKGDIPQSHWFHLGRQMTSLYDERALISWSASMFEYLMPILVMRDYPSSLLAETHSSVVEMQIRHGRLLGIPWGMSESGYNGRDLQMNYQYGPFGIPGLGLKRGLSDDRVVSPYSTALAALVLPADAATNFRDFISSGLLTDYGFYEAVDYTENRLPPGQMMAVVRNYLAHHQGMTLVAINNVLNKKIFQNRFHADPAVQSAELLLQERIPVRVPISHPRSEEVHSEKLGFYKTKTPVRQIKSVNSLTPRTHVLSNGNYTVMLSAAGSGFSKLGDVAITRWNNDPTRDSHGTYFYIHDQSTDLSWTATLQPRPPAPSNYRVTFSEHKAEFWRQDSDVITHTEVIVSARENVELRRLNFTNLSEHVRHLDLTSYLEPVLNSREADLAHPAFSNLFIQTEFIRSRQALLAHRRRRSSADKDYWGIHALVHEDGKADSDMEYETDRARFLGRHGTPFSPQAVAGGRLSNSSGLVLNPALSLKTKVTIEPYGTVRVCFVTGIAQSRDEALRLIDQYHDVNAFRREDEMAWTRSQVELRHLGIDPDDADMFQDLASALLFPCGSVRAPAPTLEMNSKSQSALWPFGIGGDLPMVLAEVGSERDIAVVKKLLHAHEYLRLKGLKWDLTFLCSEITDYRMVFFEEIMRQIRMSGSGQLLNKSGGVFVVRKDSIAPADVVLLQTAARAFIHPARGTLKEQISRLKARVEKSPDSRSVSALRPWRSFPIEIPKLLFFNGFGGFTGDGREYVIRLNAGQRTPLPWVNVVANEKEFGFLVSEHGSGFTWSRNSRENRLTPWSNDPVTDPPSEAIYLTDRETNEIWSPSPGPAGDQEPYVVRHGQGYTIFEHNSHEIGQVLTLFVPPGDEIKIARLKLKNLSRFPRKLSVTHYLEWVLGFHRDQSSHGLITRIGATPNTFLARNPLNNDFGERVAFAATSHEVATFTCDRREFLGRHRGYDTPQGLRLQTLSRRIGAGLDPCLAIRMDIDLDPQAEHELIFLLGQVEKENLIPALVSRYLDRDNVERCLVTVKSHWDRILDAVEVKTPFPELDIMVNRWLLYQTLSCRLWARSATYQSSGAFGFRDQLQDVMALIHSRPDLVKDQIVRAAAHQFPEGDVLHWWHPPSSRGVRTHFSDDLLWLPFVVHYYLAVTGDKEILDIDVAFIEGPPLSQDQEDIYFQPQVSQVTGTIYDHCVRAIDRSLRVGAHGLPLIGCGDWNDGMNRVGHRGQGESVWMAWFLGNILSTFIEYCDAKGDHKRSERYAVFLAQLKQAAETTGWDGDWYRRAYFDDGTPLGSKQNQECQIDSIAQSWAALTGLGDKEHVQKALSAADRRLVRAADKLVLLFTPPFDNSDLDPGYIKGYIPGIRENGGQYTHAAIWLAMAFANQGDGEKALDLIQMLNPINHSSTHEAAGRYQVEPYVMPADIYSIQPLTGRGGWTWYTGSASWYYRALTETILGLKRHGSFVTFKPVLTPKLNRFSLSYRFGRSTYVFQFRNPRGLTKGRYLLTIDEKALDGTTVALEDDGRVHQVAIDVAPLEEPEIQL